VDRSTEQHGGRAALLAVDVQTATWSTAAANVSRVGVPPGRAAARPAWAIQRTVESGGQRVAVVTCPRGGP
jgi:hypothetical protein